MAGWWPPTLIAFPSAVVNDAVHLVKNGELVNHTLVSFGRLIQGFTLGACSGIAIGCWIGVSRIAQRFVEPTLSILATNSAAGLDTSPCNNFWDWRSFESDVDRNRDLLRFSCKHGFRD